VAEEKIAEAFEGGRVNYPPFFMASSYVLTRDSWRNKLFTGGLDKRCWEHQRFCGFEDKKYEALFLKIVYFKGIKLAFCVGKVYLISKLSQGRLNTHTRKGILKWYLMRVKLLKASTATLF